MNRPQLPEKSDRPNFEQAICDLLASVAQDALAISHVMNAEGEKLQGVIQKYVSEEINTCEMEQSCKKTNDMISALIMKEWLLMNKLKTILEINDNRGLGESELPKYDIPPRQEEKLRHACRCEECKPEQPTEAKEEGGATINEKAPPKAPEQQDGNRKVTYNAKTTYSAEYQPGLTKVTNYYADVPR